MVVSSFVVALLWAAPPPPAQAIPPQLRQIAAKMRKIHSLQVAMTQIKDMHVFDEHLEAHGSLSFERPRKLCIDLSGAGGTTLIINGDIMTVRYKALDKTERTQLSRDPKSRAIAEHLFLLLQADPDALAKVYRLQLVLQKPLTVRLVPRPKALAQIIRDVQVRFDPHGFVDRLELDETNGDTTRWSFGHPTINAPIPASRFELPP